MENYAEQLTEKLSKSFALRNAENLKDRCVTEYL